MVSKTKQTSQLRSQKSIGDEIRVKRKCEVGLVVPGCYRVRTQEKARNVTKIQNKELLKYNVVFSVGGIPPRFHAHNEFIPVNLCNADTCGSIFLPFSYNM